MPRRFLCPRRARGLSEICELFFVLDGTDLRGVYSCNRALCLDFTEENNVTEPGRPSAGAR